MELACLKPTELGVPFYAFSLEFSASKAQGSAKVFLFLSALPAPPLLTTFSALFEQNCLFIDPPAPSLSWTGKYKKIFPCFFSVRPRWSLPRWTKRWREGGPFVPLPLDLLSRKEREEEERANGRPRHQTPLRKKREEGKCRFYRQCFCGLSSAGPPYLDRQDTWLVRGEGKSETKMTIDGTAIDGKR